MGNMNTQTEKEKLLTLIHMQKKGKGGGTDTSSAQMKPSLTVPKSNALLDFLGKVGDAYINGVNNVAGDVNDVKNATIDTGNAWLSALGQIVPAIQGKKLKNAPEPTASAQRGLNTVQNILYGNPSMGIEAAAAPDAAAAVNQVKQDAIDAVENGKAQPGGLQAGFVKPDLGIGKNTMQTSSSPVRVVLKPSVYGAGREQAVQNTVDTLVPGTTATEKYANLEPTMSGLGDKITSIMQQNPKSAPLDGENGIMADFDKNLQNEGVYRTTDTPRDQVQKTARNYITDLNNEASQGNTVLNANQISDTSLQKIKQQVNQDAQSVFKKIDNGTSLTDKDKVILAARQTLDDAISNLHPEVKDLTTQQSHLYDAADSLFKAREAEIKAANTPQPSFVKKATNYVAGSPLRLLESAGVGLTGAGVIYAYNLAHSKPKTYNFTSGDVTLPGLADITTNTGSSLQDAAANYSKQIQNINDQEKAIALNVQLGIPSAKAQQAQLENQRNTVETQFGQVKPLFDQYQKTDQAIAGLQQAQALVKNANPQWFQAFGPAGSQFTAIRAATVPGYAAFRQQVNDLAKFGIDPSAILNAASPDAANAAINQAVNSQIISLKATIKGSGGSLNDEKQQLTGKDVINAQSNAINTGSSALNAVLTPTPTQAPASPTPTPDNFQRLLQYAQSQRP